MDQLIWQQLPGNATDGSFFYQIDLNASVYTFSLSAYNYFSVSNLRTSSIYNPATITIFDSSGTIVDIIEASPTAQTTLKMDKDLYAFQISSDAADVLKQK